MRIPALSRFKGLALLHVLLLPFIFTLLSGGIFSPPFGHEGLLKMRYSAR